MALAQDTAILLLDEPTTYLDLAHQFEVVDLLADLNEAGRAARPQPRLPLSALRAGVVHSAGPPEAIVDEELSLRSRVIPDPVTGTPLRVPIGRSVTRSVATS